MGSAGRSRMDEAASSKRCCVSKLNGDQAEVANFINWICREEGYAAHGAVARWVRAWAKNRPATQETARWPDFDAMLTHARWNGGGVTEAQLIAAVTVFRAA